MKILRGIGSFIIGVILFILVLALSIIIRTKNFVENEVIVSIVKETVAQNLDKEDMTDDQKNLLEKIIGDKDSEEILQRAINSFLAYKENNDYRISKDDYNYLINYLIKYKDDYNNISNTNYNEKQIREQLKYEDFSKAASEAFKNFEKDIGRSEIDGVLEVYKKTTSNNTKLIFILGIVVCILLLMLINWSFITWMIVMGIDLIISGMIIGGIYIVVTIIKTKIEASDEVLTIINNINLSGFIIMGIIEVAVGIGLIILYSVLKEREIR